MPDGPCYEDDFYAWTQQQAEVLRPMPVSDNRDLPAGLVSGLYHG
jgi:hypothetical protein